MSEIVKYIFPNFVYSFFLLLIWSKLLNIKLNYKSLHFYINIMLLMVVTLTNFLIVEKLVRIFLITVVFMFFVKLFFRVELKKCIIVPITSQIIMFISEFICILLLIGIFRINQEFLLENFWGLLLTNFLIAIFSLLIISIPVVKKLFLKINKLIDSTKINTLTVLCLCLIVILNFIDIMVYYKISLHILMFINLFITIICSVIIFNNMVTHSKYNKVYDKYNLVISSLNSYEEMMKKYRILNHENKNILLTIRSMIVSKDKDINKYIDSILESKINDDEQLLFKISVIPPGGLRAVFYSKILKIKDSKIKYNLEIDNKISSLNFMSFDKKTIIDICNIFSVFVDNAIDETLKHKNKKILILLHCLEDGIEISVSNYVDKTIIVDELYKEGYSTKGEGRGYGLPLVAKTVNENHLLTNTIDIQKNLFTQNLLIKLENKDR